MGGRKTVLIASLNWGLGHATRCIPIIEKYVAEDWEVILASDGDALALLRMTFPTLESHALPSYDVKYSKDEQLIQTVLKQLPKLWKRIRQEYHWLKDFKSKKHLDLIISDNRYGVYSRACKSVVITHQLQIKSPLFKDMLNRFNHKMLSRFDECWVPDFEGESNLSGELSTGDLPIVKKFIGPLSNLKKVDGSKTDIPLLCILSGPEPQRTILERELKPILTDYPGSCLVRGIMTDSSDKEEDGIRVKGHAMRNEVQDLMNRSRLVICRSGYTSIMDLVTLGKKAILIPTPGQTEQEYLAQRHGQSHSFRALEQDKVSQEIKGLIASSNRWGLA